MRKRNLKTFASFDLVCLFFASFQQLYCHFRHVRVQLWWYRCTRSFRFLSNTSLYLLQRSRGQLLVIWVELWWSIYQQINHSTLYSWNSTLPRFLSFLHFKSLELINPQALFSALSQTKYSPSVFELLAKEVFCAIQLLPLCEMVTRFFNFFSSSDDAWQNWYPAPQHLQCWTILCP